jgi:beta-ureidopropionase / N-carbamoyl-L-amino-acid hydrolase
VTSIVGIDRYEVTFPGVPGHAGTVPMADRGADVVVRMAAVAASYWEAVQALGPAAVVNFGQVAVRPGSYNVIPGEAFLAVEVRSPETDVLDGLRQTLGDLCARYDARLAPVSHDPPIALDRLVRGAVVESAGLLGIGCLEMPSWAGHDAAVFAEVVPTGMIFVPSAGGISHSPLELTHESDIAMGLRLLVETVRRLDEALP